MKTLKQCFTDAIASCDCKQFLNLVELHKVGASWQAVCHDAKPSLRVVDGFVHVTTPSRWMTGDEEHDGWIVSSSQRVAGRRQVFRLEDLPSK